jgi:DnaJ-class molecular chaperone
MTTKTVETCTRCEGDGVADNGGTCRRCNGSGDYVSTNR